LWVADSNGTNPIQVTHFGNLLDDLSWAPDGKSIAVSTVSGKVYLVAVATQNTRLLFNGLPFIDEQAPNLAFSRNGKSLYVLSQPGAGENYELLKVSTAGGRTERVMDGRLSNFMESIDGTTLFYSRADGIWKRSVEGGEEQFVAPASPVWDLRSDGLYIVTNSSAVDRYSLDGKHLYTVATLGHFGVKFPMSISPDGHWALFGYEQRQTVEIDMVQGFN
jgi:Tol biopolymer transport system component